MLNAHHVVDFLCSYHDLQRVPTSVRLRMAETLVRGSGVVEHDNQCLMIVLHPLAVASPENDWHLSSEWHDEPVPRVLMGSQLKNRDAELWSDEQVARHFCYSNDAITTNETGDETYIVPRGYQLTWARITAPRKHKYWQGGQLDKLTRVSQTTGEYSCRYDWYDLSTAPNGTLLWDFDTGSPEEVIHTFLKEPAGWAHFATDEYKDRPHRQALAFVKGAEAVGGLSGELRLQNADPTTEPIRHPTTWDLLPILKEMLELSDLSPLERSHLSDILMRGIGLGIADQGDAHKIALLVTSSVMSADQPLRAGSGSLHYVWWRDDEEEVGSNPPTNLTTDELVGELRQRWGCDAPHTMPANHQPAWVPLPGGGDQRLAGGDLAPVLHEQAVGSELNSQIYHWHDLTHANFVWWWEQEQLHFCVRVSPDLWMRYHSDAARTVDELNSFIAGALAAQPS